MDDTLIRTWEEEIFTLYNKKYKKDIKYEDIKTYDFMGDENLKNEFFDYFEKNWEKLKLYPKAKEMIEKLSENHDLYVVTSRPLRDKEKTISYLESIFPKNTFKEYIFTCDRDTSDKKCEIANEYNLDVVIDDAPHHLERYIQNTNTKVFCFPQPWNTDLEIKNVTKIQNWEEF